MAIEIRQMLIKSIVLQEGRSGNMSRFSEQDSSLNEETLKQEILADCRALLTEMFREQKER